MRSTTGLSAALAALAIAVAIVAPAAFAKPTGRPSLAAICAATDVPPPPSSIAASAAKEYAVLRGCGGHHDSTIAASAPIARGPSAPTGFDWPSAAIGAAAAAGLSLVLAAALGMRRRTSRQAVPPHPPAGPA